MPADRLASYSAIEPATAALRLSAVPASGSRRCARRRPAHGPKPAAFVADDERAAARPRARLRAASPPAARPTIATPAACGRLRRLRGSATASASRKIGAHRAADDLRMVRVDAEAAEDHARRRRRPRPSAGACRRLPGSLRSASTSSGRPRPEERGRRPKPHRRDRDDAGGRFDVGDPGGAAASSTRTPASRRLELARRAGVAVVGGLRRVDLLDRDSRLRPPPPSSVGPSKRKRRRSRRPFDREQARTAASRSACAPTAAIAIVCAARSARVRDHDEPGEHAGERDRRSYR